MDLVRSAFKLFISRAAKSFLGFLAVVIFSRELGASPLGTYYPFLALLGILSIPADFGLKGAAEKRISEGEDQSIYLSTALALKIPLVILIGIAVYGARKTVDLYLGADLTVLLILGLIIDQIGSFSLSVLRAELRVGETATIELLRPLCWLVVGYALYILGYGVEGLVYGYLVGSALILLLGWWKVSIKVCRPKIKHAISLLNYAKYGVISVLGGSLFSWTDVALLTAFSVIGTIVTRGEIGAYENAWRVSLIAIMASRSISATIFPQFSQWSVEDSTQQIENIISKAALPSLLLVIPSFVGTAVLAQVLLDVLFGPEFTVAWTALIMLSAGMVVQSIHGIISQPLQAIDRPDLSAYATAISVVVNVVLNLILIWEFGILGAATATTISFTLNTVLHARYLRHFLRINLPLREASWSLLSSIVMGISIYIISINMYISTILQLLSIIALGVIIYVLVLLIYPPIRKHIRQIFHTRI